MTTMMNFFKRSCLMIVILFFLISSTYALKVSILSPPTIAGSIDFLPAMFGPLPPAGGLNALVVDTVPFDACQPLRNTSSTGLTLTGKIALVFANGNCMLGDKAKNAQAAGAVGVIFQSCSPYAPDFCPDPVVPLGLYDPASPYTVPVIMISYADGLRLRTTLTSSIYNQSVRVLIPGSGAVVASDRAILRDVYSAFLTANGNQPLPFNGHGTGFDVSGGLQRWDLLLSDVSYDPCLARAYGIYCIDGRIVWMVCNSCGAQGPLPAALGGLTALMEMDFSIGNALTSELPCAIGNLRNLTHLNIMSNQFTSLSTCFGGLTNLVELNAAANRLTDVPPSLAQLTRLQKLILRDNFITSVPNLSPLTQLTMLDLSNNKIEVSLWSFRGLPSLRFLDLHSNRFFGALAEDAFDDLPVLTQLDVSQNALTGALPRIVNCSSLTSLNFEFNQFTGRVPNTWSALTPLRTVSLSHNQLESPVSAFFLLPHLEVLDLSFNNLTSYAVDPTGYEWREEVGAFISFTVPLGIRSANLANNKLTGMFASGWLVAPWPNLEKLSIANNLIEGGLPNDLWSLPSKKLSTLDFSGNLWTGSLPPGTPQKTISMLSFQKSPNLKSDSNSVPPFVKASELFIKDSSGLFSCPQLVSSDPTIGLLIHVDPTYFDYSLCRCERGYTSGGPPPNCAAFPSLLRFNYTQTGLLSDGSSSGRLRTGADTRWIIQPPGQYRVIYIYLTLYHPATVSGGSNRTSEAQTSYQVNIEKGTEFTPESQVFFFSSSSFAKGASTYQTVVPIISRTATLHFFSDSEGGPHFEAVYNTSNTCPPKYRVDPTGTTCELDVYIEPAELSPGVQMGLTALIGVSMGITIIYTVLLMRYKSHRVIHAASPMFCFIFTFGSSMLYASSFVMIQEQTPSLCKAQSWLFNLGFTLAYGSLFTKTWRLHKIFNNKDLVSQKITDGQLMLQLLGFMIFDSIILLTWNVESPASLRSLAQKECVSVNGTWYTLALILGKGAVLMMGSYLTYKVQKVPSQFNESKYLAAATYNTILLALIWIGVVIGLGAQISIASRTMIQAVLITFGSMLTQGLLLLPKFLVIFTDTHSLEPDRRVSQFTPSMIELVNKQAGGTPGGSAEAGLASLLATQAAAKISKLAAELEKLRGDYDGQCAKYKTAEENLRKQREKIEDMERDMADKNAELDYLRDQSGSNSSISKVTPR